MKTTLTHKPSVLRPRALLESIAFFLLILFALPNLVADTVTTTQVAQGVTHKRYTYTSLYGGPQRVLVTIVDLDDPSVSIRFPYLLSKRKTSAHAATVTEAAAAVNAQFFSLSTGAPNTYLRINGVAINSLTGTGDQGIRDDGLGTPDSIGIALRPGSGWNGSSYANIITAYPNLIRDGVKWTGGYSGTVFTTQNPRTCAGWTYDNRLFLVVVDGRTTGATGMTMTQLRDYMYGLASFRNSFNFDGGGSSTMWIRGSGVVNVPSDGTERSVPDAVVIAAPDVIPPVAPTPVRVKMDVNGDGKEDLVLIWNNGGTAYARTRLSTGSGFSAATDSNLWSSFGTLGTNREWLPMDVNGDGKTDLVLIWNNGGAADARTFLSTGSGFSYTSNGEIAGSFATLGVNRLYFKGDINGDGKDDLIMIWDNGGDAIARTRLSTGSGFGAYTDTNMGIGFSTLGVYREWIPMDVNGDGKTDMVLIWNNSGNANAWVRLSTGSAFATTGTNSYIAGFGTLGVDRQYLKGDVNGDGKDDLILIWNNAGAGSARVCTSTGSAFSFTSDSTTSGTFGTLGVNRVYIPADTNGDGKTDLVLIWNNGGATYARTKLSTGSGFGGYTDTNVGISFGTINQDRLWLKEDFSGDGKDDLLLIYNGGGSAYAKMCRSNGTTFTDVSDTNIAGTFGTLGGNRLYLPPGM